MPTVNLSSKAKKDLKRLDPPVRRRIVDELQLLEKDPPPDNLDVVLLSGAAPWCRLRVGEWRVIFCNLDAHELLVARVVPRAELEKAISLL